MNLVGDDWQNLPVVDALPSILESLNEQPNLLIAAEPGAGKTTLVPLALLDAGWLGNRKILVLEPRRAAARAAANRMATLSGHPVGELVGYATRLDTKLSATSRIEVVTEGILVRRLLADPLLEDVGAILFDEFHERTLDADLGLAMALDVQGALRPDLRIVLMSATLAQASVERVLPGVRSIAVPGRTFPVETRYGERPVVHELVQAAAKTTQRALRENSGDILVFLPGESEIRRCVELLRADDRAHLSILPLYSSLPDQQQDEALRPFAPGQRKVVVATTIAETSLTIEGITAVVDAGYKRGPRYDARRGVTRLRTVRVSLAAADQRRGRAGRLGPGVCYRLWSEAEDRQLVDHDEPEILSADLAPLVLTLAAWGVNEPLSLRWIDPPPAGRVAESKSLLRDLDAIDATGAITAIGKRMASLPVHPRLAHMIGVATEEGSGALACDLAAILSEPGSGGDRGIDLQTRLEEVRRSGRGAQRVRQVASQLRRAARTSGDSVEGDIGGLVALAWPDRIAMRRGGDGRFLMASGGGAKVEPTDPLAREPVLAIADVDFAKDALEARVRLAAPLSLASIERRFAGRIEQRERIEWDSRSKCVVAQRERRLGALILSREPLTVLKGEAVTRALVEGIRKEGLSCLPWTSEAQALMSRVKFARTLKIAGDWPDWSAETLLATLEEWCGPYLAGMTKLSDLGALDLREILESSLGYDNKRTLDRQLPDRFTAPSGAALRIDYGAEGGPTVAVRLQEMFGLTESPTIAGGRVPLRFELLSPAMRPVAVTQDIASFWQGGYRDVRRDLRGRYPKHPWPEDPAHAPPSRPGRVR